MNKTELENTLKPLKTALSERIDSRGMLQGIINKHIQVINDCINQNVTISLIHATIFPENDVSFNHLKNLIYRARAKLAKSQVTNNSHEGGIKETYTQTEPQTNAFSSLAKKEQKPIHQNSSDQAAADERLNKLLMRKQKQNEA